MTFTDPSPTNVRTSPTDRPTGGHEGAARLGRGRRQDIFRNRRRAGGVAAVELGLPCRPGMAKIRAARDGPASGGARLLTAEIGT